MRPMSICRHIHTVLFYVATTLKRQKGNFAAHSTAHTPLRMVRKPEHHSQIPSLQPQGNIELALLVNSVQHSLYLYV